LTLFLQICAGLGGLTFVGGIITALAMWRRTKAEVTKSGADAHAVLTETAMRAAEKAIAKVEERAEKLGEQLDRTSDELEKTRGELQAVRRHMGVLEMLLRERGLPVPEFLWPPRRNGVS
jgi:SpoVK/Ycf46/Vps4 family AAA+-type ATPase